MRDDRGVSEHVSATATFLFTDVEGSTALLKQLRERYAEALADHHRILREAFAAHGGTRSPEARRRRGDPGLRSGGGGVRARSGSRRRRWCRTASFGSTRTAGSRRR
jgi:class 3 adenylate cyclase